MHDDVGVVGSINVDLMLTVDRHPHPGETLLGGSGAHLAGGKGANQAVAAARAGARTAMVDAAARATRVAAASVQRLGAQASYPWKDDPLP